jgi:NAD(P)H-binding
MLHPPRSSIKLMKWLQKRQTRRRSGFYDEGFGLGAAGSVGQHILRGGIERGHELTALVRRPEKLKARESRVRVVKGDALDKDTLEQAVRGQDASIYALGTKTIGRTTLFSEYTRNPHRCDGTQKGKALGVHHWCWSGRNQGARRIPLRPDFVSAHHETSIRRQGRSRRVNPQKLIRRVLVRHQCFERELCQENLWRSRTCAV